MIKNSTVFEIKKDERLYQFIMPSDAPLGEIHDVLFQMKAVVVQKINEYAASESKQETKSE